MGKPAPAMYKDGEDQPSSVCWVEGTAGVDEVALGVPFPRLY